MLPEPDLKEYANRYPHLYLREEEVAAAYAKDTVRLSIQTHMQGAKAKRDEYQSRVVAFAEQERNLQHEITRLKTEMMLAIKKLDTERRVAKGNVNMYKRLLTKNATIMQRLTARYSLRNIQLFRNIVNRRLAEEGRVLRLKVGRRAAKGLPEAIVDIPFPQPPEPTNEAAQTQ